MFQPTYGGRDFNRRADNIRAQETNTRGRNSEQPGGQQIIRGDVLTEILIQQGSIREEIL